MLQYYLNGQAVGNESDDWPRPINLRKRIRFIGNSEKGDEPFGIVADLRVYPYSIEQGIIEELADASPEYEKQMPDKHLIRFLEEGIPQKFIFRI